MLGISWFQLAGAVYLSQFPSCVRFTPGGEEAVVTLFLTVIAVRITTGLLLRNCLLGGRVSARIVPRGAVGIGQFSIDLWLASPFRLLPKPSSGSARSSVIRFLVDLFGIAVSGGVFVVPLYALLAGGQRASARAQTMATDNVINSEAMVVASVATMGLLAAGVSVPRPFLLSGSLTLGVALLSWHSLPSFAFSPELSETPHR